VRESELFENEHRIGEAEFPDADRDLPDWHRPVVALMTRPFPCQLIEEWGFFDPAPPFMAAACLP
jgi:hypothetical protein